MSDPTTFREAFITGMANAAASLTLAPIIIPINFLLLRYFANAIKDWAQLPQFTGKQIFVAACILYLFGGK